MKYLVVINLESGECFIENNPGLKGEELEEYIDQNFGKLSSVDWGLVDKIQTNI